MVSKSSEHPNRIVAVGLLTQRDVDVLGTGFRRLFAVDDLTGFDDLLKRLNAIDGTERPR